MTIDEIKELLQIFNESGVGELEVQRGEDRLRIKRAPSHKEYVVAPPPQAQPAPPVSAGPTMVAAAAAPARAVEADGTLVKSPIVGTYYDSPSPDAAPFVRVGDAVEPGQVLCIIESMKLMNEIEADATGEIVKRLVTNGQPVEYGQPLFAIRTA